MRIGARISLSFLLIAAVLTAVTSSVLYFEVKSSLQDEIFSHLATVAGSRAEHVRSVLDADMRAFKAMASYEPLPELVAFPVDEELQRAAGAVIANKSAVCPNVVDVSVLDAGGMVMVSTDAAAVGSDWSHTEAFLRGRDGVHIGEPRGDISSGAGIIDISAPVIGRGAAGVIVGHHLAEEIFGILSGRTGLGKTGVVYLVNGEGRIISPLRPDGAGFEGKTVGTVGVMECLGHGEEPERVCACNRKTYPDYRQVDVAGVHSYLPGPGWCLLAEMDANEAFASLGAIRRLVVGVVAVVPLVAWLLGIVFSRAITGRICRLCSDTEQIGKGDLDHKVGAHGSDEIGQLSVALDRMTEGLKKSTAPARRLEEERNSRQKAEDALRRNEDLYRDLIENANDLIQSVDEEGRFVYVNKKWLEELEYGPEEVGGLTVWDVLREDQVTHCTEVLKRVCGGDSIDRIETVFVSRTGKEIPVEGTINALFIEGKLAQTRGIFRNITERKKAEDEMNEAVATKSRFISMVSHELRTPLTAIKEGIDIVEDASAGPINVQQKEFLGIAKTNVDRLARLINDVLDFQKLESDAVEPALQAQDMNSVVREVYDMMLPLARDGGLKLVTDLDETLPLVSFDRDGIVQVLANVVGNAIKFTEKGSVTLMSSRAGNIIKVSIRDTGRGISKEDMPRLFQEFEQLGSRKPGSTGLGLAISREIIRRHRGKIWAESEPGQGTTFSFILPIHERRLW